MDSERALLAWGAKHCVGGDDGELCGGVVALLSLACADSGEVCVTLDFSSPVLAGDSSLSATRAALQVLDGFRHWRLALPGTVLSGGVRPSALPAMPA